MALVSRRIVLRALAAQALGAGVASGQTRTHRKPKPLGAGAVSDDWRSFLGPSHNAVSAETTLTRVLPPPLVWEMPKGTGYASPAVAGTHLVFVHRLGDEEIVECLHPETGARRWQFRFGTEFEDRYGYNNGPRSSPVVDGDRVFTVGAEGRLHCLDLATGALLWKRDLRTEYKVFISASYRTGSALVDVRPDFTHRVIWTTQEVGLHFNTAVYRDGYLYGFDGRNESDASLTCVEAATGKVVWRNAPEWTEHFEAGGGRRPQVLGTYRGALLAVDGQFLCLGELGHLLWMNLTPKGYKEVARAWLFAARESWALPVLSRGLLYVVQNTRDALSGAPPRLLCYDLRG